MEELKSVRGDPHSAVKAGDLEDMAGLSQEAREDFHPNGESSLDNHPLTLDDHHKVDSTVSPVANKLSIPGEHVSIIGLRPDGTLFSPAVLFWQFKRFFFRGVDKDIVSLQGKRNILTGDLELMHAHAAHYDNRAEYMYSFLQIMTASAASFTHGANDVSK